MTIMKSIVIKAGAAIALGLITAATAASAETTVQKVENGTTHVAKTTYRDSKGLAKTTWTDSKSFAAVSWDESKKVGRTIVYSPVIAYDVMRGERPLFSHPQDRRQQIALTGHSMKSQSMPSHYEPPI
jgi:hypothetical protein